MSIALKQYFELTKPRVVALIVFTAIIGMFLAVPGMPPWKPVIFGSLGIWLAASSAAAINHLLDQRIDALMARTAHRPLPSGGLNSRQVLVFAVVLGALSMLLLVWQVNVLTAALTFASLIGYAIVYTGFLKRATPQNIVIGGLAGAAPPALGWVAITDQLHPYALLLVLIIFVWTPPHFWALAIHRKAEYAKVDIPMLPVTHGEHYTKIHILLYTAVMFAVTLLPYAIQMSGWLYLVCAVGLGLRFFHWAIVLYRDSQPHAAINTFKYSIWYLFLLFIALLVDHYLMLSL
jgi:protoheme IX farnesyltransferase